MEAENTNQAVIKTNAQEQHDTNALNQEPSTNSQSPKEEERCFSEAFYEEQASRLEEFFSDMYDPNQLRMLQRQLDRMKIMMDKLKMPWDQYIPIMHKAFMLNYDRLEGRHAKAHALRLSTELISVATFLAHNGRLIDNMSAFFHKQAVELNEILDKEK